MSVDRSILETEMDWYKCIQGDYVFYRKNLKWKIRMNNLPEDLLYTLFVDGKAVFDFDEWPLCWYQLD